MANHTRLAPIKTNWEMIEVSAQIIPLKVPVKTRQPGYSNFESKIHRSHKTPKVKVGDGQMTLAEARGIYKEFLAKQETIVENHRRLNAEKNGGVRYNPACERYIHHTENGRKFVSAKQ